MVCILYTMIEEADYAHSGSISHGRYYKSELKDLKSKNECRTAFKMWCLFSSTVSSQHLNYVLISLALYSSQWSLILGISQIDLGSSIKE